MKVRATLVAILLAALTACSPAGKAAEPDPVDTYRVLVDWLVSTDMGLNQDGIFAIDVSDTGLPEPDRLFQALAADPRYQHWQMMSTTRAELTAEGLIVDDGMWFPHGFLIEFSNPSITADKVTVKGSKWVSGLGAIYATLTADWKDGAWIMGEVTDMAIS